MGAPIVTKDEGILPGVEILQKSIEGFLNRRAQERIAKQEIAGRASIANLANATKIAVAGKRNSLGGRVDDSGAFRFESPDEMSSMLVDAGFDNDRADNISKMYFNSTVGGRTHITKQILEEQSRMPIREKLKDAGVKFSDKEPSNLDNILSQQNTPQSREVLGGLLARQPEYQPQQSKDILGTIVGSPEGGGTFQPTQPMSVQPTQRPGKVQQQLPTVYNKDYVFPTVDTLENFAGLTPKERVARENENLKANAPIYRELDEKYENLVGTSRSIRQLKIINDSHKLPAGAMRVNINPKTGGLVWGPGANEETQAFVKTINEFANRAKDFYGARVTNFDLESFMKTLPGLMNTEEGRRLIIEQMRVVNEIQQLYNNGQIEAFNKIGKKNVDSGDAIRVMREGTSEKLAELDKQHLRVIDTQKIYDIKNHLPKGFSYIESPDGLRQMISPQNLPEALKLGWTKL